MFWTTCGSPPDANGTPCCVIARKRPGWSGAVSPGFSSCLRIASLNASVHSVQSPAGATEHALRNSRQMSARVMSGIGVHLDALDACCLEQLGRDTTAVDGDAQFGLGDLRGFRCGDQSRVIADEFRDLHPDLLLGVAHCIFSSLSRCASANARASLRRRSATLSST